MSLSEVIKSINAAVSSIGNVNEEERREALAACDRLRTSLENPIELVGRLSFSVCSTFMFLIFLTNLSLNQSYMSGSHSVCRP